MLIHRKGKRRTGRVFPQRRKERGKAFVFFFGAVCRVPAEEESEGLALCVYFVGGE